MALHAAEALLGFRDPKRDPASDHPLASPSLDVAADSPKGAVHVLDGVGRREGAAESGRQPEPQDGERLVEALAKTRSWRRPSPLESEPGGSSWSKQLLGGLRRFCSGRRHVIWRPTYARRALKVDPEFRTSVVKEVVRGACSRPERSAGDMKEQSGRITPRSSRRRSRSRERCASRRRCRRPGPSVRGAPEPDLQVESGSSSSMLQRAAVRERRAAEGVRAAATSA